MSWDAPRQSPLGLTAASVSVIILIAASAEIPLEAESCTRANVSQTTELSTPERGKAVLSNLLPVLMTADTKLAWKIIPKNAFNKALCASRAVETSNPVSHVSVTKVQHACRGRVNV